MKITDQQISIHTPHGEECQKALAVSIRVYCHVGSQDEATKVYNGYQAFIRQLESPALLNQENLDAAVAMAAEFKDAQEEEPKKTQAKKTGAKKAEVKDEPPAKTEKSEASIVEDIWAEPEDEVIPSEDVDEKEEVANILREANKTTASVPPVEKKKEAPAAGEPTIPDLIAKYTKDTPTVNEVNMEMSKFLINFYGEDELREDMPAQKGVEDLTAFKSRYPEIFVAKLADMTKAQFIPACAHFELFRWEVKAGKWKSNA